MAATSIDVFDKAVIPYTPAATTRDYTERDLLLSILAQLAGIGSAGGTGGGPATIADGSDVALGAKANAAVTNPASSASAISLLKGLLTESLAMVAALAAPRVAGFNLPAFDCAGMTYVGSTNNVETITYKTGGSGGTTVATLTFTYVASGAADDDDIATIAKS